MSAKIFFQGIFSDLKKTTSEVYIDIIDDTYRKYIASIIYMHRIFIILVRKCWLKAGTRGATVTYIIMQGLKILRNFFGKILKNTNIVCLWDRQNPNLGREARIKSEVLNKTFRGLGMGAR